MILKNVPDYCAAIFLAENGHTVPAIETLEKMARALAVPMYQLFYDGEKPPALRVLESKESGWGNSGSDRKTLDRFRSLLGRANAADQKLLMHMANKMAGRKRRVSRSAA